MHLTNWKAKRAGARITVTVTGTDENGNAAKIVGVDAIEPGAVLHGTSAYAIATDKNGATHRLII